MKVSREGAARFLLAKQGLLETDDVRPWRQRLTAREGALAAIQGLECVQIDPVALVAPNHHLVLRNRVRGYEPGDLDTLLASGRVFEYWANARCFLPMEEYPVFWWRMQDVAETRQERRRSLGDAPSRVVEEILTDGRRTARSIRSSERVLGYWDLETPKTKASTLALELLWESGELMIARREGNEKFYDLPERIVPEEVRIKARRMSKEESSRLLFDKYFRAYSLFDTGDARLGWRKLPAAERRALVAEGVERGTLVPVEIRGVKRSYYVQAVDVPLLRHLDRSRVEVAPRVSLLSPLDNLLWRRERVEDLFRFEYRWEIYLPRHKRRFGAYVMPILRGDSLIGRVNPRVDRESGVLFVDGLWLEDGVTAMDGVEEALAELAGFVGAQEVCTTSRVR